MDRMEEFILEKFTFFLTKTRQAQRIRPEFVKSFELYNSSQIQRTKVKQHLQSYIKT